jgi:hypothetical protein
MTADYGIPLADTADLDRAYAEEKMRRAHDLSGSILNAANNGAPADLAEAEELTDILHDLGIHLDHAHDYNITGGDA